MWAGDAFGIRERERSVSVARGGVLTFVFRQLSFGSGDAISSPQRGVGDETERKGVASR